MRTNLHLASASSRANTTYWATGFKWISRINYLRRIRLQEALLKFLLHRKDVKSQKKDYIAVKKIEDDGLVGEKRFRDDLDRFGVAYLPIDQAQTTYAQQFHGVAKRPDSLLLLGAARFAAIESGTTS